MADQGQDTSARQVSAEEVLSQAGLEAPGLKRQLLPLQRTAAWFATGVGVAILVVTALVIVDWYIQTRRLPPPPAHPAVVATGTPVVTSEEVLNHYARVSSEVTARPLNLFDTIVVRAFVPVLTLLLGYLFGIRQGAGDENASS